MTWNANSVVPKGIIPPSKMFPKVHNEGKSQINDHRGPKGQKGSVYEE